MHSFAESLDELAHLRTYRGKPLTITIQVESRTLGYRLDDVHSAGAKNGWRPLSSAHFRGTDPNIYVGTEGIVRLRRQERIERDETHLLSRTLYETTIKRRLSGQPSYAPPMLELSTPIGSNEFRVLESSTDAVNVSADRFQERYLLPHLDQPLIVHYDVVHSWERTTATEIGVSIPVGVEGRAEELAVKLLPLIRKEPDRKSYQGILDLLEVDPAQIRDAQRAVYEAFAAIGVDKKHLLRDTYAELQVAGQPF